MIETVTEEPEPDRQTAQADRRGERTERQSGSAGEGSGRVDE